MKTETIHKLADSLGVSWDGDKNFMDWCSQIIGKRHLDDMTHDELLRIFNELKSGNYTNDLDESIKLLKRMISDFRNQHGTKYE